MITIIFTVLLTIFQVVAYIYIVQSFKKFFTILDERVTLLEKRQVEVLKKLKLYNF